MAGDGVANTSIAESLDVSRSTILQWRAHFESDGVGWVGEVHEGRGRKPVISQEVIDQMINDTLHTAPPEDALSSDPLEQSSAMPKFLPIPYQIASQTVTL